MQATAFPVIEDRFRFNCTLCGDCCTGDQEVLLNWYDLYNMARFLHFEHTGFLFSEGWVELVPDESHTVWRPRIRFKEHPFRFCPFLTNELDENDRLKGYCQLHEAPKPLVCALAPVGCRYDAQAHRTQFILVPPTQDCPGMEQPVQNRLSSYLQGFEEALRFQEIFFEILEALKHKNLSAKRFEKAVYGFPVKASFPTILGALLKRLQTDFKLRLPEEVDYTF